MQFSKSTVFGFFDGSKKSFIIPVYQRAYSWTEKEWMIFLEDLKEQIQGNSNYFFGNILLETIEQDRVFEVIDGQQRLTTLTIFIRAVVNVLRDRINEGEKLDIELDEKETTFLRNGGITKLRPVEYDRACYDTLVIENKKQYETSSPSQEKIRDGKAWFIKELSKLSTADIQKILLKIETTAVTRIEFEGKKDAALMFELQNNRGKDLTNMERLKSYFMYQLFVYSKPDEANSNIEYISNLFKAIYNIIADIRDLDEDSVLIYHCNCYVNGYDYRTIEDIKIVFKKSTDKIKWINTFVSDLHTTFANIKKLEKCKDSDYLLLKRMKIPAFAYPFIIKGYKYFDNDEEKLNKLFKLLEVVLFRHMVIRSGASINSRLNQILLQYEGDNEELKKNIRIKFNSEHHWSDDRLKSTVNGYMYTTPTVNYLLWRYEASIQGKGYVIGSVVLDTEDIEHISPQTPPDKGNIAPGYEVDGQGKYAEAFLKEHLNSIGNLMLIASNHNRSIGNVAFSEKLESYNKNPILNQQSEIKLFASEVDENPRWDVDAIIRRKNAIIKFTEKTWSLS
jgi:uncharacterized protein with ParB-like and HNH nuclease domain